MKLFLVMFAGFCASLTAADTNSLREWLPNSATFRSVLASKYLAFGNGATLYDKPAIQSDIFFSSPKGLYADLWSSFPINGKWNQNYGSEIDYAVGWAGDLSKMHLAKPEWKTQLDIGVAYFNEPNALALGAGDIIYTHVRLSKETKWVTLYGLFENYSSMPDSYYSGGNLLSVGASKGVNLFSDRVKVSSYAAFVYDDGGFGLDSGFLLRGGVEVDVCITKRLTLIVPQVNYYVPIGFNDGHRLDAVVFGGFSYKFW